MPDRTPEPARVRQMEDAWAILGPLTHDVVLMSNWRPGDPLGDSVLGRIDALRALLAPGHRSAGDTDWRRG